MPATPAYIRVLTAERLRAERPIMAVPAENKEAHAKRSESKLTGIINQAPQLPAQASLPQSSTIITLDDGRILIPLAIPRRLGIVSTLLARPVWKRNNHQGCLCLLR